jgi:hypothetical protein
MMVWVMVFNAIFNNISVISWRSVLLVEETAIPGENHQPVAGHWQTSSHNFVSSTPRMSGFRTHNVSDDRHTFLCMMIVTRLINIIIVLILVKVSLSNRNTTILTYVVQDSSWNNCLYRCLKKMKILNPNIKYMFMNLHLSSVFSLGQWGIHIDVILRIHLHTIEWFRRWGS